MTKDQTNPSIGDAELHAYADGLLDAARAAEVAAFLEAHPEAAAEVAEWQAQNEAIRTAFALAAQIGADDMQRLESHNPARRRPPFWRLAAAVLLLALGAAGGYGLHDRLVLRTPQAGPMLAAFPTEAGDAYITYAAEVRHAVEVPASESEHLTTWLGKRLDYDFTIPDLSGDGLSFIGGRLLPLNGRPGAMLLYQDEAGVRLSVIIAQNDGASDTAFQFARDGDVGTYYWIDGPRSYAISGRFDPERLRTITGAVYAHFEG